MKKKQIFNQNFKKRILTKNLMMKIWFKISLNLNKKKSNKILLLLFLSQFTKQVHLIKKKRIFTKRKILILLLMKFLNKVNLFKV